MTASAHGDSVESSRRPGAPSVCEPNCADNLLLFDRENGFFEGETNSLHPIQSNIPSSEKQLNESQNAGLPKSKKYKRRNRSRPNRHGARSFPSQGGPKDVKQLLLGANNEDQQNDSSNCNSSPSESIALKVIPSDGQVDMVLNDVQALESAIGLTEIVLREPPRDLSTSKSLQGEQHSQPIQVDAQETSATAETEDQSTSALRNGYRDDKKARKSIPDKGQNSSAAFSTKGLDSDSSCARTSHSLDANNGRDLCNNSRHIDSNRNNKEQSFTFEGTPHVEGDEMLKEYNEKEADGIESSASINDEHSSVNQMQNEVKCQLSFEGMEIDVSTASEREIKPGNSLGDNLNPQHDCLGRFKSSTDFSVHDISNPQKENPSDRHHGSVNPGVPGLMETALSFRGSADAPEPQICAETQSKLANKAHEDSILEEARIVEVIFLFCFLILILQR